MGLPPLAAQAVRLGCTASDKSDAIAQTGQVLLDVGAIDPPYVDAMHERERSISTYIGEGVAIPHGTDESRSHVQRTALSYLQFPAGVDWDGQEVKVCIGIASQGDEHVGVLASLARVLLEPGQAEELRTARSVDEVLRLLQPEGTPAESEA